jgi:hydrogenase large subunit
MLTIKTIDPVTRLEGHLKISVTIDTINGTQQVVDAKATGTLFRGFESLLINRDPRDAQHITERICGVCPVAHGTAAVLAQDALTATQVPANARIMRNVVLASNFIQSHILHFYHLAIQDYVDGPAMAPWQPSWNVDKRFSATQRDRLVNNYVKALEMRRKAHEMSAVFGGRLPHPPTLVTGGITAKLTSVRVSQIGAYLSQLVPFIRDVYIPDADLLAATYPDYYKIGAGPKNLLAFGVFPQNAAGSTLLFKRGRSIAGSTVVQPLDVNAITEQVKFSWYADSTDGLRPSAGQTTPQYPKNGAYSWLKAPRYSGLAYEAGPLARMWVNGDYRRGISVMDRHAARAREALKIAQAMQAWLPQLTIGGSTYVARPIPTSGSAMGLTEAPRGALGHWVQVAAGKISRYQVVTPTCWNASPRDGAGKRGPIEEALVGTPVKDVAQPIEVLRVIHSFDPCLSCAVHVMRPAGPVTVFAVEHTHGPGEAHGHGDCHIPCGDGAETHAHARAH